MFTRFKNSKFFNTFCYFWVGIFSTLSFAPYGISELVFIAPFGLFWIEEKYRGQYKVLLKKGLLFSIVFCFCSYYWINYMLVVFGGFPFFIAIPLFLLYCLIVNWKFGVFMALFSFLKKKIGRHNLILPGLCIILAEFFTWQIFPWYYGNLLAGNVILSQVVEYTGVYGLSILVFIISYPFFQYPIWIIIKSKSKKYKSLTKLYLVKTVNILALFALLGGYLYWKWSHVEPIATRQVLIIQPDAPLEFRDGRVRETMEALMNRIEKLVIEGSENEKPDLVVLPESGVPFYSTRNAPETTTYDLVYWPRFESLIFQLSNRFKTNIYFNEIDASFVDNKPSVENLRFHNSSTLFDPNGNRGEFYRKSYLLAFGEYIPLGETFPILYKIIPQIGRFLPGEEQNLITYFKNKTDVKFNKPHLRWIDSSFMNMQTQREYYKENATELEPAGKFLPLICYEVILPEFVRKFYKNEMPDFIVNITNDKWYGNTVESYEHLDLARLRSIEFRRWMVRGTNSGTSAFVDHLGRIVNNKFTPLLSYDRYSRPVDVISSGPTFYLLYGNLLVWLFIALSSILFGYKIYIKSNYKRQLTSVRG
ncbi:MAG TPA: nitrilase-related carbon-nitrogen hydrolase [Leptospiraceae bacterium]|nr:nitrilase-related carbon-nitrogen hydrolase [Leptospiraceae bacterium]HMX31152.1 nitrilase-related carbon-nitrogen hydrolase [Leptospiraceae bacterium]HMY30680.1 nitrilase-related carbon-nitrogen hydrolase [Leptospiraceae bacterium]HNA06227.1 nitrilase-related carbon-nitrogen hydrolase [Leptospiraceae bacterium]HNC56343.1 nitrilase-related carbon-nitrogen hydrolase [Leptospiraceae bacterium]